ncbi:hyaluronidase-4 [Ornithorhynchus anatinus]|uniref:Hyaluronidase n=1 Tax=Ornithorhynchus anatinus TaxID=9258 RepID=F7GA33_ORNAN|nr:hyaluronidase-4 [Ornithorhynchus anatinus]
MKRGFKRQLKVYIIQPTHLLSWLLISFLLELTSSLKPAQHPIFQKKPFVAVWNAPTDQCLFQYNTGINLRTFHITGSPLAKARGQNVTIFFVNRLGYYPWYNAQEDPINGGLPQNASLQTHLIKANQDIRHYISAEDFRGLAMIEWEYWRPQWSCNWNAKDVYRRNSRQLISERLRNLSDNSLEHSAKVSFEESAKAFMKETIELGMRNRPRALWGYYLYPDCHSYNFHEQNYTGSCPEDEVLRNNELFWLWNSSAALYPSISVQKALRNSKNLWLFSWFRVNESLRISTMMSCDYALPVFVYTRLGYRDAPLTFLSKHDLISTIGESAALGAAGIVIWGDMNLTSSEGNCTKVKKFVTSHLGNYLINVTTAAEECSRHHCGNNGRCTRKAWNAHDYLHLNPQSYYIEASENEEFMVKGKASGTDSEVMEEKFSCHCYRGYGGADCRNVNPSEEPPGSPATLLFSGLLVMLCLLALACHRGIQL